MCKVKMDWSKEESLNFAIYNLIVMQGNEKFTEDLIVNQLKTYNGVPEESKLKKNVGEFLKYWVEEEIIQQHWDSYSLLTY